MPDLHMSAPFPHHIVIVGGGAAGLELATKLGTSLGRSARARITLIDKGRTHIWKPLLHSIAAGSLVLSQHGRCHANVSAHPVVG
jgi:NADH dehydrogenase